MHTLCAILSSNPFDLRFKERNLCCISKFDVALGLGHREHPVAALTHTVPFITTEGAYGEVSSVLTSVVCAVFICNIAIG